MSRPESPLRNNLTEDETTKKLKLMLIKEKRINKENSKLISDLNFNVESKSKENTQLINQIQRLSENIGYLQETESSNSEEINVLKKEISNLNNKSVEKNEKITKLNNQLELIYEKLEIPLFSRLQSEDSDLIRELENRLETIRLNQRIEEESNRFNKETIEMERKRFMSDIDAFKSDICLEINGLLEKNKQFIPEKVLLSEQDELNIISTGILSLVNDLLVQLTAQIDSNGLLQDGIDKLVFKCNDLETIIANQNEKSQGKDFQLEVEQKDEQIKRLEELIEDNRNISRALETERDQLQNDLVDLRERHEEKEGYLMEEYREAKQNLESYRILNDKESACKVNEIERLRELIDQYQQQESSRDKSIIDNDCRFCQQFELLARTLKEKFEIVDENSRFSHEEVIEKVIEKFDKLQSWFNVKIESFQQNEIDLEITVEKIRNRIEFIEENQIKTNKQFVDNQEIDLLEIKKSNENLLNENNRFVEIFNKIDKLANIDCRIDRNNIIDFLENSIEKTESLNKQINQYKSEIDKISENYNQILLENKSLALLKSINENLTQTIEQLKLTNLNCEEEKELLTKNLLEKKSEIDEINENYNKLLIENQSLQILKSNYENCEEEKELLKNSLLEKKSEIDKINENYNQILLENQSLALLRSINENLTQTIEQLKLTNFNCEEEKELLKNSLLEKKSEIDKISEDYNKLLIENQSLQILKSNYEKCKEEKELETNNDKIESINNEFTVRKEDHEELLKDKMNLEEIINNMRKLLNIDENSPEITVIDEVKNLTVISKQMTETINEITDKYNKLLNENQSITVNQTYIEETTIPMLENQIKSMESDLQNKINMIDSMKIDLSENEKSDNEKDEIIEKIKEILNIDENSNIIDKINNLFDQLNLLKSSINQYKSDIESLNGKYDKQLIENKSLIDKFNDFELIRVNYEKEIELSNKKIEEKMNIIENINSDLLKYRESNSMEIIDKLREIFNIDSSSDQFVIIDYVKKSLTQSEYMTNLINQYQSEIETIKEKSDNLSAENQFLSNKLEEINKNSSGSDLMNLEMAEFDKTLINLNNQLLNKSSQIDDMEIALKSKEQLIASFQQQLTDKENRNSFLEERGHKMKQLLVKTKRELADCKSELEKLHKINMSNSERIELLINQMEESKFQLSETLNEKEKFIDQQATILKRMETISKNKDIRLVDLKSQLDSTINNYQLLQKEFDSYKVKAQNALSTQQRPKPTFSNFMTQDSCDSKNVEDADKKELKKLVTDLELLVKDLKIDLQESDDKNFSLKNEMDNLRWENEKWIDKYKSLAKENNELVQKYQQAVKETQEIDKIQKSSYSNFIEKYEVEKENLMKSYLNQIEINKSNFENQILNLEQKLSETENEKLKYQEEIWTCREQLKNMENKNTTDYPVSTAKYQSWPNNFKTPFEHERQQGEGMETTSEHDDIDSPNNQHLSPGITFRTRNYNNALIPLDKLLNSDDTSSRSAEEQMNLLSIQTQSYKKKIEHLTMILNDSEATVSRLTEQAKILKAEIRRLEQNEDRESKLTDEPTHEYLKNVIMKFLDYETKLDERGQLVPVIVTLLSLNLHEKEKLITFSKIIQFDRKSNSEGWSSYFNWTGIS